MMVQTDSKHASLQTGGIVCKSLRKQADFSRVDLGIVRDFDSELTVKPATNRHCRPTK